MKRVLLLLLASFVLISVSAQSEETKYLRYGYRAFGDLSFTLNTDGELYYTLTTIHGRQLKKNDKWFVGLGGGLPFYVAEWEADLVGIVGFVDTRYEFKNEKVSPYIDLQLGGCITFGGAAHFRSVYGVRVNHFNFFGGFALCPYSNNPSLIAGISIDWKARYHNSPSTNDVDIEIIDKHINYPNKGYRGIAEGTIGEENLGPSITHGYQFNPHLFIGAGLGFNLVALYAMEVHDAAEAKVFGTTRYEFKAEKNSPFAELRLGIFSTDCRGLYTRPSAGYRINKLSFFVGVEGFVCYDSFTHFITGIAFDWGSRH